MRVRTDDAEHGRHKHAGQPGGALCRKEQDFKLGAYFRVSYHQPSWGAALGEAPVIMKSQGVFLGMDSRLTFITNNILNIELDPSAQPEIGSEEPITGATCASCVTGTRLEASLQFQRNHVPSWGLMGDQRSSEGPHCISMEIWWCYTPYTLYLTVIV